MANLNIGIEGYGDYSSENYSAHALKMQVGSLCVWFSYKTPVAFAFEGKRIVRQNDWKTTTGKHLNWIDNGNKKDRVSGVIFEQEFNKALNEMGIAI